MKKPLLFLVIIFAAAVITVPGHVQFNKFINKKERSKGACLGGTRHSSYILFSLDYIDYCNFAVTDKGDTIMGLQKMRTDKWLGAFGMFLKLKN